MSLLRLESVGCNYQRGASITRVLRDVSLEVEAGRIVGIYGRRGSGKTTLLKIAAGIERPTTGTVLFRGKSLSELDDDQLADVRRTGIAFAEREPPHIDGLPVIEHVAIPLYGRTSPMTARRRAGATLARLGIGDCRDHRWSEISDAARVLVSLAHALVRQPELLVVDDLTACLGTLDRDYVISVLRSSAEDDGAAVLMTTPDTPELLQVDARMLSSGRLIAPAASDKVVDISTRLA